MKTGEKRLLAWLICVLAALVIWSGLHRVSELIPVRGAELPECAIEMLTERVENGQAYFPMQDLRFREVYMAQEGRFCFVNGYFDAGGIPYRYAVALYRMPFGDWYVYDTSRELIFEGVSPEKRLKTWVDFLIFRYHFEVFYDRIDLSRSLGSGGECMVGVLLLAAVCATDRFFHKKGDKDMQQLVMAVAWVLYLVVALAWIAAREPNVHWVAYFA